MEQIKIDRINELARLSKTRPLTEEEKQEQAALRAEYIRDFRASFGGILDHTVIERPDGSREKLKKQKYRSEGLDGNDKTAYRKPRRN